MVYFLSSALVLFSRKFLKIVTGANCHKMAEIKCAEYQHKNFANEKLKRKHGFFKLVYLFKRHWKMIQV